MDNWLKPLEPRAGGWNRLNAKLMAADEDRRWEAQLTGAVATVLILVTAWVAAFDFPLGPQLKSPAGTEITAEKGHAIEVPGTPSGVRFYWIVQN